MSHKKKIAMGNKSFKQLTYCNSLSKATILTVKTTFVIPLQLRWVLKDFTKPNRSIANSRKHKKTSKLRMSWCGFNRNLFCFFSPVQRNETRTFKTAYPKSPQANS